MGIQILCFSLGYTKIVILGGICFKLYQILRHAESMNGNSFNWLAIETLCFCKKRGKMFPSTEEQLILLKFSFA